MAVDIKDLRERIERKEQQINDAEKKKANLEGKKEGILDKLKSEFDISENDDIEKIIEKNQNEIDTLSGEIEYELGQLEEEWEGE